MPTTEATDQPKNTKVMALPRFSGDANCPMQAAACGVKMAGATMAATRIHKISLKPGTNTHRACAAPDHSMTQLSNLRRSCLANTVAKMGALRHISTAPAVMRLPACVTETWRSWLMSLRPPGTISTPKPMTKLPNKKHHKTAGEARFMVISDAL